MIQRRQVAIHVSILLIATGTLFLLANLGAVHIGPREGWPVFPVLLGALAWIEYFARGRRGPYLVGAGLLLVLTGAFFFAFTLPGGVPVLGKLAWRQMGSHWPAFPAIVGVALAATWVAAGCRGLLLVPAAVLAGVSVAAVAIVSAPLADLGAIARFWPLAPIGIGAALLARTLLASSAEPTACPRVDAEVPDAATFGDRA